jgi:hypothetical protein
MAISATSATRSNLAFIFKSLFGTSGKQVSVRTAAACVKARAKNRTSEVEGASFRVPSLP